MKAAADLAIRFAMEHFQKGEVEVNAVHQMLEHITGRWTRCGKFCASRKTR